MVQGEAFSIAFFNVGLPVIDDEKYEITADGRHPFDEEQIVLEAVRNKKLS